MALLTRDKLLEKKKFKIEKVDLGDGDFVYVREMSGYDKNVFELSMMKENRDAKGTVTYTQDLHNFRGKLLVNTLCDEHGTLLLGPDDSVALAKAKDAILLERLADAAQKLNAIGDEERDRLIKKSKGGRGGSSTGG